MGFGSYDESEQESQEEDTEYDEEDAVNVHENDHEGDVSVEGVDDTSSLVAQLEDMQDDEDDE